MLKYTVSNVDFTKLTTEMQTNMKAAVTEGVLQGLGGAYTSDDIAVELNAGSVVAEVTVTPKGETASELQIKASQATMKASLETAVQAKIVAVPDLFAALTSGTLADISTSSDAPQEVTVSSGHGGGADDHDSPEDDKDDEDGKGRGWGKDSEEDNNDPNYFDCTMIRSVALLPIAAHSSTCTGSNARVTMTFKDMSQWGCETCCENECGESGWGNAVKSFHEVLLHNGDLHDMTKSVLGQRIAQGAFHLLNAQEASELVDFFGMKEGTVQWNMTYMVAGKQVQPKNEMTTADLVDVIGKFASFTPEERMGFISKTMGRDWQPNIAGAVEPEFCKNCDLLVKKVASIPGLVQAYDTLSAISFVLFTFAVVMCLLGIIKLHFIAKERTASAFGIVTIYAPVVLVLLGLASFLGVFFLQRLLVSEESTMMGIIYLSIAVCLFVLCWFYALLCQRTGESDSINRVAPEADPEEMESVVPPPQTVGMNYQVVE